MADAKRLIALGMVPPLAKEVAAQITAGVGNARRLVELSMVPILARELTNQINSKVGNARRLAELGMVPVMAKEVAAQVSSGVPSLLPREARAAFLGDSVISQSVCSFMKSQQLQLLIRTGGRLILAEAGDKGIGGTKSVTDKNEPGDSILARVPRIAEQKPDIVFALAGGNDNPSSSPATVISGQLAVHNALRAAVGPDVYIVWQTLIPGADQGTDPGFLANLKQCNDALLLYDGTDGGKTLAVDVSTGFDYPTMTYDNSHTNDLGARFIATRLLTKIGPLLPTATLDDVLDEVTATRGHGANLANSKWALPGTGGTVSNTGGGSVTGQVANTMLVTNTTSATVECSKEVVGAYERQVIRISGTVTTEGMVTFGDGTSGNRTNIALTPGDYSELVHGFQLTALDGVSAPLGVRSYGSVAPTSPVLYSLGQVSSADANSPNAITTPVGPEISRSFSKAQATALGAAQLYFGVRLKVGVVDVQLIVWKPIFRKMHLTAYRTPVYVGADKIKSTVEQINAIASTIANGATLTARPGSWLGGGLTFSAVRIYKNGTGGGVSAGGSTNGGSEGLGTGTLLATLAAGTWTWTAAGLTSGDNVWIEVDATNSFGTATARSSTAVTVP